MKPSMLLRLALFALALTAAASGARAAAGCPIGGDSGAIAAAIRQAGSCRDAAALGDQCAFGASGDVALQDAVIAVCEQDFLPKLKRGQHYTYHLERSRCRAKYAQMEGTMYVSAAATCEGKVAQRYSAMALKKQH